ncbi:hypothetical protein HMPREF0083_00273 [Aneurinibacillus aneurinilyticus ATCC 12856]|uniref:Uncharacterized protein n=1 Tax=Aneurinibacillus aneurinilyticus ATCC 12856 TaxID=649747 RepID=U1YLE0_ANEAE|nr:hypothetical protein HMPREF0083_00273 [Aneurinibacillus aneurinilyticus ATCC 12856]
MFIRIQGFLLEFSLAIIYKNYGKIIKKLWEIVKEWFARKYCEIEEMH